MGRLIIIVVLALCVFAWVAARIRRAKRERAAAAPGATARTGSTPAPQGMVACAHCGVHLPRTEALTDARERSYCGEEHRRLGAG